MSARPTFREQVRAASANEDTRLAVARRDGPFLAWRDADGDLHMRALEPGVPIGIGREEDSTVVVPDQLVSREHVVILVHLRRSQLRTVHVIDAGSRHGTECRPIGLHQGSFRARGPFVPVPRQPARPLQLEGGDHDLRLAGEVWLQIGGVPVDPDATGDKGNSLPLPTRRERDVLIALCRPQFLAPGRRAGTPSNAEIARLLDPPIGAERVSDLLSQLYLKYGLAGTKEQNRSELVELALRHLLTDDSFL